MTYIRTFLLTGVMLPAIVFYCLGTYIEPISGDLTRIGSLAEREYGWNAQQPAVPLAENRPESNPSVIVLGDSFSDKNVWQSVANAETGLTFLTFKWPAIENVRCIDAWVQSLRHSYPFTKHLIIETVERSFQRFFQASELACNTNDFRPIRVKKNDVQAKRNLWLTEAPDPLYVMRAIGNIGRSDADTMSFGATVAAQLATEKLFSSRRSNLLLYYALDDEKRAWTPQQMHDALVNIAHLQQLASSDGFDIHFMIVPDKSTAYGSYLKVPQFPSPPPDVWRTLNEHEVTQIDLKVPISNTIASSTDLYLPDDTHLGNRGYALVGHLVADKLKQSPRRTTHSGWTPY